MIFPAISPQLVTGLWVLIFSISGTEEKKSELARHRNIIIATIDYVLERVVNDLEHEEFQTVTGYYQ
jgi:hypothetical protein